MTKFFIMGQPYHDNIGDIAIWCAEKKFLEENFSEHEVISFSEHDLIKEIEEHKDIISDNDIIFMQGGGNIGNQYIKVEESRREVIKRFPNNSIIIFPQTIYFTDDENGKNELEKSRIVYSSHKDLTMVIRERKSLELAKKYFPNVKVVFLPDIVTYLYEPQKNNRQGALIVFRKDAEKSVNEEECKK